MARIVPHLIGLVLLCSPAAAQEQAYPVPDEAAQRALQRELPAVVGALEERVVADCEAVALGGAACLEVLAWAAGESWSQPGARTDYAERAVALAEKHLAADDPRRATAYIAMARAVEGPTSDNIDCEKPCPAIVAAQPWLEKAKAVLESATPRDHLALALIYRELGGNLYQQGKRDGGELYTERTLATLVDGLPATFGRLRREIEDEFYFLETEQQRFAEAERLHRMRIAATEQVEGEGLTLARDYAALSRNLTRQGQFERARKALENAISLSAIYAADEPDFELDILVERSSLAEAMGDVDGAIAMLRRAIVIAGDEVIKDNLNRPLRVRLGKLLEANGQSAEAQLFLVQAYVMERDNLLTLDALATNLANNDAAEDAEKLYHDALAETDDVTGIDEAFVDLDRAYLRMGLGRLLLRLDRVEEAETQLEQGVIEWQRMLPTHTAYLDLRFLLAEAKARLARGDDALGQLSAASALTASLFGTANPLRIDTDRRAAVLLKERLGLHPAAWTFFERATSGAMDRIESYTSFDSEAQRELRGYRPLFLQQIGAAWRYSERSDAR